MVNSVSSAVFQFVSFADRTRTPRTKQQRQRKSWRKSARSSRSLEESCPTGCCSVMWERRVEVKISLLQSRLLNASLLILEWQRERKVAQLKAWADKESLFSFSLNGLFSWQIHSDPQHTVKGFYFPWAWVHDLFLFFSWSFWGGSVTAPPLWLLWTQQIHQQEVNPHKVLKAF